MGKTRVYVKAGKPDPKRAAELKATREFYQKHKPGLAEALADAGRAEPTPLGEVLALHSLLHQLRAVRKSKGVTLKELSRRTGIHSSALSRLETGRPGNPTIETVSKIARAMGVRVTCQLEDATVTDGAATVRAGKGG